jgi:hypothetical protein
LARAAFCAAPPKPRTSDGAGGAGSRERLAAPRSGTSDALFRAKVQSILDNFSARLGTGRRFDSPHATEARFGRIRSDVRSTSLRALGEKRPVVDSAERRHSNATSMLDCPRRDSGTSAGGEKRELVPCVHVLPGRLAHNEHSFSGLPPIGAGSEPCRHLRSAPHIVGAGEQRRRLKRSRRTMRSCRLGPHRSSCATARSLAAACLAFLDRWSRALRALRGPFPGKRLWSKGALAAGARHRAETARAKAVACGRRVTLDMVQAEEAGAGGGGCGLHTRQSGPRGSFRSSVDPRPRAVRGA